MNVALTSSGEPVAEAGEYFLCRRHNMRFKLVTKVSGRKTTTKAKGVLFLTTHRLVFINENRRQEVQSFVRTSRRVGIVHCAALRRVTLTH